ncbi:MAG: peptidoglycan-binding domain-containing protein, partial [Eubacteriales bacterium]|nr:peptidoglycan-binding domain-containing protein [Eubacteriales bacterium]
MRKVLKGFFVAALCISMILPAVAESDMGQGAMVVRNAELAAYVDGEGNAYLTGYAEPINTTPVDRVLAMDVSWLLALTKADENGARQLIQIGLADGEERVIAQDVYAACLCGEKDLYYVCSADRTRLMRYDLADQTWILAQSTAEYMENLYAGLDGLILTFADDAGAMYLRSSENSAEMLEEAPAKSTLLPEYGALTLDANGLLFLQPADGAASEFVDSGVLAYAALKENVYYLSSIANVLRIKVYNLQEKTVRVLSTPAVAVKPQITTSAEQVFVLGVDDSLYSMNLETGALTNVAKFDHESYVPEEGWELQETYIEGMSGQVNIYAVLREISDSEGAFTFEESAGQIALAEKTVLVSQYLVAEEKRSADLLKPAVIYETLRFGNRGDAVTALQQKLIDLKYLNGKADGIFGSQTQYAVKLLQYDLGQTVNGVADAELQRTLLEGDVSAYDPYKDLARGDQGLRVQ